jgi:two-component system cell cycle sensor histidine kinase/response regulator CckA
MPVKADWRVFASILLVIFGVELAVMMVMSAVPPMPPFAVGIVDALALAVLSAPLLWLIVAKPLALGAEAERLRLEARVASILQTSVDGILTTDARGTISQFNAGAEKIFGYAAREVVGQNINLLLPERARTAHQEHVARSAAGPDGSRATGQGAQLEGRRKNGEIFPADVTISKLGEGDDTMYTAVVRDATERKRAEEAAQRSQKRLRDLIDGLGPSMFVGLMTLEGILIEANRPALAAAGLKPEDVLGKPFEETYWWAYSQEVQQQLREAVARAVRGEASRYDVQVRAAENHLIDVDFSLQPLWDETGEVVFLVPSANVITDRKQAEEVRKHREAELQESQRIARIGSWEWMVATGVVTWSDGMNHILAHDRGSPSPTFEGLSQFYTAESWQRLGAVIARAVETGASYDLEVEMIRADGATCWTTTRGEAIRGADGTVVKLRGTVLDITERKRAEEERRESEAQRRSILNASPDAITIADLEGRMLLVSPAALKMFGCEREEELLGHMVFDFMVPGDRDRAKSNFALMFQGVMPGLSEYSGLRLDGSTFDVEVNSELVRDAEGQPSAIVIIVRDIAERKQAEKALRLQAAALHVAADAIVITDRAGVIEWVNPSFTRLTGYTAEEALGKNPRDLVKSGKHAPAVYKDLWETILAGRTWHGEMINRQKDGTLYTEDQAVTPILDASGAVTHFVAIKEDITERLRLQAQLLQAQKMESVGRLAGGVAHDFNNLLSVILGWTGMALEDLPAGHAVRPSLEEVLKAGEGAANLTRQLLAFSRQQVVEPTFLNVNDHVVEMDKMFRRLIGEDIQLVTSTEPELGTVKLDRGQLEQVLMNLVVNARDAMPEGGKLTIKTANVVLDAEYSRKNAGMTPGEYVMLAVSDSGVGMSEEVKAKIFEPFFTTKEREKGTGLGLATCYGITKQAGGYIAVDSEEGVGTTMKVYLPRRREAAVTAARRLKRTPVHGVETILLVEDEPAVRRVTARMLETHGYRVVSTSSGEEALRVIEEEGDPLQLLLTDVVLAGGMSGRVLADRVRALRPDLKVLFVSGYTSDVTILHGLLEHSVALVQKPFTAESLASKVRQVLDAS